MPPVRISSLTTAFFIAKINNCITFTAIIYFSVNYKTFIIMRTIENIKTKLKEIFIDAIGFNPFDKDDFYHHSLIKRFMLDQIDFLEIVVRIEKEFHFNITNEEEEKIACMNIDKLTNFIHSKCSKC